jgi:8-hydroxy-5-deazaflavin:NADPH oxidoreductase
MKITILGTGNVGQTLAEQFIAQGHDVIIGTRSVEQTLNKTVTPNFSEWLVKNKSAQLKAFDESIQSGEIVINALNGGATLEVFKSFDPKDLENKIIIDISNPLDFSKGFPPVLIEGLNNSNSLGEALQNLLPNSFVIKTLNTMWCGLMLAPNMIHNGQHINFVCGNNPESKNTVIQLLMNFGWAKENILDLGDITNSRGTEAYLLLWTRIYAATQNGAFNLQIAK